MVSSGFFPDVKFSRNHLGANISLKFYQLFPLSKILKKIPRILFLSLGEEPNMERTSWRFYCLRFALSVIQKECASNLMKSSFRHLVISSSYHLPEDSSSSEESSRDEKVKPKRSPVKKPPATDTGVHNKPEAKVCCSSSSLLGT